MSMTIGGPMPLGPVTQREIRSIALRQVEHRVEDIPTYSSLNRNSGEKWGLDIRTTVQDLEHISLAFNRRLKFVVDHESKEVIVKVIDNETDKVIKELPPKELQRLHQRIQETVGFLFDELV